MSGRSDSPNTPLPKITLFTTPTCHWCRVAKRYLTEHDIPFQERDVHANKRAARDMILMTGQRGVPVIRVGERAMVGWDEAEFKRLLKGSTGRR